MNFTIECFCIQPPQKLLILNRGQRDLDVHDLTQRQTKTNKFHKQNKYNFVQSIACECKDPNAGTTTTTAAPCVDIHPTNKCEKRKKKGKCSKNWMKKKCAKTCEQC